MLWDEAIPPLWPMATLKLQFGEMKQEERGREGKKKKKILNVVAIGYRDPKLHAKEHRELTAHVCNLHCPSARTGWNRNNAEHPKRRCSLCVCITEHSCSLQTPPLLDVFYRAKQKSSARQKGRKGSRTGTDAPSTGSSYHVHGAMAILLLLDTHRSNKEKVNT